MCPEHLDLWHPACPGPALWPQHTRSLAPLSISTAVGCSAWHGPSRATGSAQACCVALNEHLSKPIAQQQQEQHLLSLLEGWSTNWPWRLESGVAQQHYVCCPTLPRHHATPGVVHTPAIACLLWSCVSRPTFCRSLFSSPRALPLPTSWLEVPWSKAGTCPQSKHARSQKKTGNGRSNCRG